MSRPYGYDEGYQDGYEAAEIKLEAAINNLRYAKEVLDNPPPGYDFAQSDFDSALAALLEQK